MHAALDLHIARWRSRLVPRALLRRPFLRNVAMVAGGTAVAQAIAVAFSPIITRLYGPEAFGVLGVFTSVVSMLLPIASLCYVHAIVLPPDDADALRLLRLSNVSALAVAALAAAIIVPFREAIAGMLGLDAVAPYLLLAPVALLLGALFQSYDQWLIRTKHFRASSAISISHALAVNTAKASAGLIAPVGGVLIGIATGGHGLHALLSAWSSRATRRQVTGEHRPGWSPLDARARALAHEYRDFALYRTPQIALNSFSQNLPVLMLATLSGPAAAGFYALGQRVLKLPSVIISQAVGKVFQQRIAEAAHKGQNLQRLLVKTTLGLAVMGVVPFGVVTAFGPALFALVFGSEWHLAGEYARWLALWLFFGFINVPSVMAVPVLSLQGHLLALEVVTVAGRVAALLAGVLVFQHETTAVALFSLVGITSYVVLIAGVIWMSGNRLRALSGRADLNDNQ